MSLLLAGRKTNSHRESDCHVLELKIYGRGMISLHSDINKSCAMEFTGYCRSRPITAMKTEEL